MARTHVGTARSHGRTVKTTSRMGSFLFELFNYSFMLFITLSIVYPFWQLVILSFSGSVDATTLGFHFWPTTWKWDAFRFVFGYEDVMRAYLNSILRTVIGTLFMLFFTIVAAYPLAKRGLPFRTGVTIYFLIPMFFSGGMIPTYLIVKQLGLIDNFLVYLLPGAVSIFNVIIMRNYFMTIDPAFEESAFMDGASYPTLLLRIILPISLPVIATIALWSAVYHWNSWFDAMIYIRSDKLAVIQLIMQQMLAAVNEQAEDLATFTSQSRAQLTMNNVRAAVSLLCIGPIVLVYPYLQKYFIKGITLGSLKG